MTILCSRFAPGHYDGFQNWKQWKKKPRLSSSELKSHAQNLMVLISKPWVSSKWDPQLVKDIEGLMKLLDEMATYLDGHCIKQTEKQASLFPTRKVPLNSTTVSKNSSINNIFSEFTDCSISVQYIFRYLILLLWNTILVFLTSLDVTGSWTNCSKTRTTMSI